MPAFSDAQYDGETVTLASDDLRLDVHRKPTGWGWGELHAPDRGGDDPVAVLEHFGEVRAERFPHRLFLVAEDVDVGDDALRFDLELQPVADFFDFDPEDPPVTGELHLTLDGPTSVGVDLDVEARTDLDVTSVRGPWLRVGADSFGADRDDGIFPGLEWVVGDEWSSGTDHAEHPHADRVTPHPNRVAVPTMAVSEGGTAVGLSWDVDDRPQPVFATPNFVDNRDDSVLGLMYPTVAGDLEDGALAADPAVEIGARTRFEFDATVSLSSGGSLAAVTDWVRRNGLPDPGEPRYDWPELIDVVAEAYDTNLWHEGEGFGHESGEPSVPAFVERYVDRDDADPDLAASLREKAAWCRDQDVGANELPMGRPLAAALDDPDRAAEVGDRLLAAQTEEGAFPYEPEGRHASPHDDWIERTRPLGQPGETDVGFCTEAAAALFVAARETGDDEYADAAVDALEFAMRYDRPAGDDWWETPIHGPNLFAAGKSAVAYELGHEETGDPRYRERARHWLRALLPFTHLWEPDDMRMTYNTKPCFDTSFWYAADWTTNHVEWEVLSVFETMAELGLDWSDIDPELDWDRYHRGITTAVQRWMVDSDDPEHMESFRYDDEVVESGEADATYTDVFNPVDGWYGGALITPSPIGVNAMILDERGGW